MHFYNDIFTFSSLMCQGNMQNNRIRQSTHPSDYSLICKMASRCSTRCHLYSTLICFDSNILYKQAKNDTHKYNIIHLLFSNHTFPIYNNPRVMLQYLIQTLFNFLNVSCIKTIIIKKFIRFSVR